MFRITPNACTKRNMARFGRASPPGTGSRAGPSARLRVVESMNRYVKLDEIENILFAIAQKERKSWPAQ